VLIFISFINVIFKTVQGEFVGLCLVS